MRATLALALAALAAAQADVGALPACAQSCIGTSISSSGCQLIDYNCICSNKSLISGLACCVGQSCTGNDIQKTLQFANTICAQANPPVSIQQQATCAASSSTGPARTSAASSSAATGASSSSAAAATTTGAAGSTASSASTTAAAASASKTGAAALVQVEYAAGLLGAAVAGGAFFL